MPPGMLFCLWPGSHIKEDVASSPRACGAAWRNARSANLSLLRRRANTDSPQPAALAEDETWLRGCTKRAPEPAAPEWREPGRHFPAGHTSKLDVPDDIHSHLSYNTRTEEQKCQSGKCSERNQ